MPELTRMSRQIGAELRMLRTLAGLSQRGLRDRTGISQPGVHRIENGHALPTLDELNAWLDATTDDPRHRNRLTPWLEAAHNPTRSWEELLGDGDQLQDRARGQEEQCSLIRTYLPSLIPGLLQTAEYARQLLAQVSPPGADVAVQTRKRLDRQQILYRDSPRFEFVIGEPALRWAPGPGVMSAQLDRLMSLSTLASVELRVLPMNRHGVAPWHDFSYREPAEPDEAPYVTGELLHAEFIASTPDTVRRYKDLWDRLWAAAATGDEALRMMRERLARA